jgi:hypothetical protein
MLVENIKGILEILLELAILEQRAKYNVKQACCNYKVEILAFG